MKLKRLLSMVLTVALLFTTVATVGAASGDYDAMEFVVTADKVSVAKEDTVIITITGNGRMSNLSTIQYQIVFDPAEFSTGKNAKNAFEADFYDQISDGAGIGAIATPKFGLKDSGSSKLGTVSVTDSAMSGETDDGDTYMLFIDEGCDLYGKTTGTLGKIVFTALADIDDISDCFTLQAAKTAYGDETGTLATNITGSVVQLSATLPAMAVMAKIDAVASEEVTYSSKAAIEAARSAYEALGTDAAKTLVTNYSLLQKAEADLKVITDKMDEVKKAIDDLATITSLDQKTAVDAARQAFAALAKDEKAALADYETKLKAAEDAIAALEAEEENKKKAQAVEQLIAEIGTVTLDSLNAIETAEEAWTALGNNQKYVSAEMQQTLVKARETYNTLVANHEAADEVEGYIDLIPQDIDKENAEDARAKIDTAKDAYDLLGDAQSLVSPDKKDKLDAAVARIEEVEKAIDDAAAVDALIIKLGTITLDSVDALDAIQNFYDGLSDEAQSYVENYQTFLDAKEELAVLQEEEQRVQDVITLITDLGSAEDLTLDNKEETEAAIAKAELAYEALGAELQQRVPNGSDLKALRTRFNELLESEARVNNVINLIAKIGPVTLDSNADITSARAAYDNLSDEEQERVENYGVLQDAEDDYKALIEAAEQEVIDRHAAAGVDKLITEIGEVTLNSGAAIDAAKAAYAGLTETQKGYVKLYDDLLEKEDIYNGLVTDKKAVDSVIEAIDRIGTVEYEDATLDRIEAAQLAYDNLREDLRDRVTNYASIAAALDRYEELKTDALAVEAVINSIDEIADLEIVYTAEIFAKLDEVQKAYDGLKPALKDKVTNYSELEAAWALYHELEPEFDSENEVEDYEGLNVAVVAGVSENTVVSDGQSTAVVVVVGEEEYHVFATDYAVDPEKLTYVSGTPEKHIIGDVDGNGSLTATDALWVTQYAARLTQATEAFANDKLKYIIGDVYGSTEITALDALAIAKVALGQSVKLRLVVGMNN